MSHTALANQPDKTTDSLPSDEQWLVQLMRDTGLKGQQHEFETLAQRFQHQPHILKLIAAYLKRWYAGRLHGLESIPGLSECKDDNKALALVLNALESRLSGTSDITLMYLLSLSEHPVPQANMQSVFRSTFTERWLTRRDDYVRFLGPLERLNEENWHWVVENLRRLQLLEPAIPGQHDLLFVAAPIRQYFSRNLRERNLYTFEQASADMDKLFKETVVDFRQRYLNTPEIKSWISPELRYSLEQEERQATASKKASLWKQDELNTAQNQLSALRNSLGTLKMQAERLQQQLLQSSDGYSSTDKITAITDKVEGTIVTTAGKGAA